MSDLLCVGSMCQSGLARTFCSSISHYALDGSNRHVTCKYGFRRICTLCNIVVILIVDYVTSLSVDYRHCAVYVDIHNAR